MELVTIIALLLSCLVALILVLIARREAEAVRRQAQEDAARIAKDVSEKFEEARARESQANEREQAAQQALNRAVTRAEEVDRLHELARELRARALGELESASGLSAEEAREALVNRVQDEALSSAAIRARRIERRAIKTAESRARSILSTAIQRVSSDVVSTTAVTLIDLPSEDLTGRIIGKEGRNIRAFEAITGAQLLVDELPGKVLVSALDAGRREVAAEALRELISDGRIHPQRIEEVYDAVVMKTPDRLRAAAYDAANRAGVSGLHREIIDVLGHLHVRTSSGQSVLDHLVESALVAAHLAEEIGADTEVVRRAAFLHDIGKGVQGLGAHAALGAEFLERLGESSEVVHAVAAHHDEIEPHTVTAVLVQAADAVSAARPGARRQDAENYLHRVQQIEHIALQEAGVSRALAFSSGREVRVIVEPDQISDEELPMLAERIARSIDMGFVQGGEVRVTVVRELRATAVSGKE